MVRKDLVISKSRTLLDEFPAPMLAQVDKPKQRFLKQTVRTILLIGGPQFKENGGIEPRILSPMWFPTKHATYLSESLTNICMETILPRGLLWANVLPSTLRAVELTAECALGPAREQMLRCLKTYLGIRYGSLTMYGMPVLSAACERLSHYPALTLVSYLGIGS